MDNKEKVLNGGWSKIPNLLIRNWYDLGLTQAEVSFLLTIMSYSEGWIISPAAFSGLGYSARTIKQARQNLQKKGWIKYNVKVYCNADNTIKHRGIVYDLSKIWDKLGAYKVTDIPMSVTKNESSSVTDIPMSVTENAESNGHPNVRYSTTGNGNQKVTDIPMSVTRDNIGVTDIPMSVTEANKKGTERVTDIPMSVTPIVTDIPMSDNIRLLLIRLSIGSCLKEIEEGMKNEGKMVTGLNFKTLKCKKLQCKKRRNEELNLQSRNETQNLQNFSEELNLQIESETSSASPERENEDSSVLETFRKALSLQLTKIKDKNILKKNAEIILHYGNSRSFLQFFNSGIKAFPISACEKYLTLYDAQSIQYYADFVSFALRSEDYILINKSKDEIMTPSLQLLCADTALAAHYRDYIDSRADEDAEERAEKNKLTAYLNKVNYRARLLKEFDKIVQGSDDSWISCADVYDHEPPAPLWRVWLDPVCNHDPDSVIRQAIYDARQYRANNGANPLIAKLYTILNEADMCYADLYTDDCTADTLYTVAGWIDDPAMIRTVILRLNNRKSAA